MNQKWAYILAIFVVLSGITGVCTAVTAGTVSARSAAVQPVSPVGTGFFDFRCNIEGATVFLDDNAIGSVTGGSLIVEVPVYDRSYKRQLRMEAPGYTTYNETLLTGPKPGKTMVVRGVLQVLPFNLTGTLSLAVSPPGSEIFIDGISSGVIPDNGILSLHTVKYGNRDIMVKKAGYQDHMERVYIEPNMVTKLRVHLIPVTTGSLLVTSSPHGASVSINRAPYGVTPLTVPDLEQGTYLIGVTHQNYQPSEQQIAVQAGQVVPVSVVLVPVPTPTATLATPISTPTAEPTQAPLPFWISAGSLLAGLLLASKK